MKSNDMKPKRKKIQTLKQQEQGSFKSCSNNTSVPIRPKRKRKITRNKKRKLSNKKSKNKGSSTGFNLQNNTQSPVPVYNRGDVVDLSELLFTPDRDFLITYEDRNRPVQRKHLEGKVIVLHFLPLVPWSRKNTPWYETNILVDVYHHLQPKGGFEVVFIGVAVDHAPFDNFYIDHPTREKCFQDNLSIMPWPAIPFSDVKSRTYWESIFPLSCFLYYESSTSVVIDPTGRVSSCDANSIFFWYGAQAYPFTDERCSCLLSEDEHAVNHHLAVTELLASPERNHLINNKNQVVPLHNLEDKVVGLFFFRGPYHHLTTTIKSAYEALAKENNFEIVLVYIHDNFSENLSEESYWESFKTMPWLALPYKDPVCKKLRRVFHFPQDSDGPWPDPSLVFIGPRGKFAEMCGADILVNFKFSAYPFSRDSVAKLVAERIRKKTNLSMFWPGNTSFLRKDGSMVEFSQLVGKKILLVVENDRYSPDAKFWRRLRKRYLQKKGTNDEFEVIHVCEREEGYSYGKDIAPMSWLSHPSEHFLGSAGCKGSTFVETGFKGVFGLFAFDHDGSVVRRTLPPSIKRRNVGFPFGDMEKELLQRLEENYGWDQRTPLKFI